MRLVRLDHPTDMVADMVRQSYRDQLAAMVVMAPKVVINGKRVRRVEPSRWVVDGSTCDTLDKAVAELARPFGSARK